MRYFEKKKKKISHSSTCRESHRSPANLRAPLVLFLIFCKTPAVALGGQINAKKNEKKITKITSQRSKRVEKIGSKRKYEKIRSKKVDR